MRTDYFHDKVALVTGGARGIGLAIAELLASRGARVVISDVNERDLREAEAGLAAQGATVMAARSDVSTYDDCAALVRAALERFGKLDILVNNAGVSIVAEFEKTRPEVAKKLMDVNLMGSIYMTMAALDALKQARGHVVFLSSVSGLRAIPEGSMYSASKAALRSLAESLRVELRPFGVHVGAIMPGFTTTDPRKTVMNGDGSARPINRPPHDTPRGVARAIARMIEKRRRETVLTPLGKLTALLQRLSPRLLDFLLARRKLRN
jgi:NAD(P)-dependent dehydrogenase (short-subunit alcohol dehydrogenase family)